MTQFGFLHLEWSDLHEAAQRAERLVFSDARASAFHARRALELAVQWLYKADRTLVLPYQDNLSALIHDAGFRDAVGPAIFAKARLLKDLGNAAVHSAKPFKQFDALSALRELFHIGFWLARNYARGARPPDKLAFDPALLPKPIAVTAQATLAQLQAR